MVLFGQALLADIVPVPTPNLEFNLGATSGVVIGPFVPRVVEFPPLDDIPVPMSMVMNCAYLLPIILRKDPDLRVCASPMLTRLLVSSTGYGKASWSSRWLTRRGMLPSSAPHYNLSTTTPRVARACYSGIPP